MKGRKIMRWVLIAGLLFGCTNLGWGADQSSEMSTLTVSGMGTLQRAPDTAIVTMAVETAGESFHQVQENNSTTMQRVVDRVIELGVKPEHIQTTSFDITPQYAPRPRRPPAEIGGLYKPKIIGYIARNTITLKVRELETVGRIVDGALSAGANRLSGVGWTLRKKDAVYLEALEMAAEKARQKARVLAKSLDVQLVRLATVHEGGVQPLPRPMALKGARMAMEESTQTVPMSPGEIQVQARVELVFEIGPGKSEG